jgi:hypothetical protein
MKQGTYGWCDVGHVAWLGAGSMLDAPSHEYQRNVGVIAIPCAVGGSLHSVAVVGRLQDNLYATAALTVVAVDDAIFDFLSDASRNTNFLCFSWFCNKLIVPLQANLKHITILSSEEDYEQIL